MYCSLYTFSPRFHLFPYITHILPLCSSLIFSFLFRDIKAKAQLLTSINKPFLKLANHAHRFFFIPFIFPSLPLVSLYSPSSCLSHPLFILPPFPSSLLSFLLCSMCFSIFLAPPFYPYLSSRFPFLPFPPLLFPFLPFPPLSSPFLSDRGLSLPPPHPPTSPPFSTFIT